MISNNVNTNGYFEYGTNINLGYNTNSAFIGSQTSTQYSNLITNLNPNTNYYCRAVITNANGTYRGEIMNFKTSTQNVEYIDTVVEIKKPFINYVKGKKITKYITTLSNKGGNITCEDVDGNKDIVKRGDKLATVSIESLSQKVRKGDIVDYKLLYRNTGELTLSNVLVKLTIPKELAFVDRNIGEYNAIENSIILQDARLRTGEVVEKIIKVKVGEDMSTGKSLILNAYLSYELLDTKGKIIKDEVTNYTISTISEIENKEVNKSDVEIKNSNRAIPNNIAEWLTILILIVILGALSKVILKDFKKEKK